MGVLKDSASLPLSIRHVGLFPWRLRAEPANGAAINKTGKILVRFVQDLL